MLIAKIENGWQFQCYDYGWEPTFDSIVFRLQLISEGAPSA